MGADIRPKLAVIIADGLRADVARSAMGYLQALVEADRARQTEFACDLPGISRPLYATLLNGQSPVEHGIVSNLTVASAGTTWLDDAHRRGLSSVVVAYHWFYELLSGQPFEAWTDRHRVPAGHGIRGAAWYFEDAYPDSHAIADAEALRLAHDPDILLVHPMGPDDAGHRHGGDSVAYRACARKLDHLLALTLPRWSAAGFDVVLTSDHGMGADHQHGGDWPVERLVPFYWIPSTTSVEGSPGPLDRSLPVGSTGVRPFIGQWLADNRPGA
jgi:predicted AlkP superfamily pyrophosphatase or phosphodiesterase